MRSTPDASRRRENSPSTKPGAIQNDDPLHTASNAASRTATEYVINNLRINDASTI